MEEEKPQRLACTIVAVDATSDFSYMVCSVCEKPLPSLNDLCKFCRRNAFRAGSFGSKRLFRLLMSIASDSKVFRVICFDRAAKVLFGCSAEEFFDFAKLHPFSAANAGRILEGAMFQMTLSKPKKGLPPPDRLGVYIHEKRHELQDAKCLSDYGISSGSMLDVYIKPSLGSLPSPSPPPQKGNIQVLTPCGKRLYLQVKLKRKVQVLRAELVRLQQLEKFELSSDYFFIHNYNVLNEKASFRSNCIEKDAEIEIVHGSVHLLLEELRTSDDIHIYTCRFLPLLQA